MTELMTETEARPTESPPGTGEGNGAGAGTGTAAPPRELGDLASELIAGAAAAAGEAEPSLQPPSAAVTGDGIGLWVSNKQIDALYSTYAARFSWMHVAGGVWRRFSPVSDAVSQHWRCWRLTPATGGGLSTTARRPTS